MTNMQSFTVILVYPPCPSLAWLTVKVKAFNKRQASQRAINQAAKFWDLNKNSKKKIVVSSIMTKETQERLI